MPCLSEAVIHAGQAKARMVVGLVTEIFGVPYEGVGSRGGFSLNKLKKEASC